MENAEGYEIKRNMKILQVITRTDAGGAQMVLALLANEQIRLGHEVIVVSGPGDGSLWKWLNKDVKRIECSSLQRAISFKKDFETWRELRRIYKTVQSDIVHLHTSKAGVLGRMAFPKRKTIYTVHGFDGVGFSLYKQVEWLMQFRCSALVGVCENDVKGMKFAHIKKNVSYIFNGIAKPLQENLLNWNIPNQYSKIILCVARLAPPKNHILFINIARLLPEYAFVWIGNTEPVVEQYPENVFFLGTIPSASQYCQLCDIFMLPSNYEGLPMTIIEAMSYGKPVVASNVGGVSEIVRDGINGYALQNEENLFVEKIQEILGNQEIYSKMSKKAKEIFETELSVEYMTKEYLKIYNRILKNNL
ncbi:glycosyltransferase [Bacteroides acidifaciens]|uniref:glycosyltransferase n=1 Tax=Bacteroides acidifaciens TaxID=85831 RepID=UPI002594E425|nr:glycosyltransferase [Bacteroides acidifaciens]